MTKLRNVLDNRCIVQRPPHAARAPPLSAWAKAHPTTGFLLPMGWLTPLRRNDKGKGICGNPSNPWLQFLSNNPPYNGGLSRRAGTVAIIFL